MSACEKCWADTGGVGYLELMKEREAAGRVCTSEEQAGPDAGECRLCKRKTLHQYTGEPMCGCPELFTEKLLLPEADRENLRAGDWQPDNGEASR